LKSQRYSWPKSVWWDLVTTETFLVPLNLVFYSWYRNWWQKIQVVVIIFQSLARSEQTVCPSWGSPRIHCSTSMTLQNGAIISCVDQHFSSIISTTNSKIRRKTSPTNRWTPRKPATIRYIQVKLLSYILANSENC